MDNEKPLGLAFIGAGRIANTVAKQIFATKRHKLVAVYSRTFTKAKKLADKFGGTAYSELDEFFSNKEIEAVYIATPHSCHYQYILDCINNNKAVICEKAFTVNAKQATAAIKLAKEKNIYLSEAMWSKFNPVVKQVVGWVNNGEIGEIKSVRASFCLPLQVAKPFVSERVYKSNYAGGALLDLGVYPIAYSYFLLGVPEKIQSEFALKDNVDIDDKFVFEYNNGAKALLYCSLNRLKSYFGIIKGENGVIISPMFYKPSFAVLISKNKIKFSFCKSGYVYEFDQLKQDLRNGLKESSVMTFENTLDIMNIMDECRKQNNFEYPKDIENVD